jgi:hypothetical protein
VLISGFVNMSFEQEKGKAKPNHSNYRCTNDPAVIGWDIYTIDR